MSHLLPFLLIILATAIPSFLVIQSRLDSFPTKSGPSLAQGTLAALATSKGAVAPLPSPPPKKAASATLTLKFQPFKNQVDLLEAVFSSASAIPAKEPWQKEGKFVLKIEHRTASGAADYTTWSSVDAIKFLTDPAENPIHTIQANVPYEPRSTVHILEPGGHREYNRFLLP